MERTGQIFLQCGEKSLKQKVVSVLERNMQTIHFEIAQLAANMGRLAGNSKPEIFMNFLHQHSLWVLLYSNSPLCLY